MPLESIIERFSKIKNKARDIFIAGLFSATISLSPYISGCNTSNEPRAPINYPPSIETVLSSEARTDRDTTVTAYIYGGDVQYATLNYIMGNGYESSVPMSYYGNGEFVGRIPRPNVDDYFLENPADYIYFSITAHGSAGSASDPPDGYYYTKLYASEYDARDAMWHVLDNAMAGGFFYPMTYISEDEWAELSAWQGSFYADVDIMDHYIDGWWYNPYFGFEYLIDSDYESDRLPIESSGYTPQEISFIRNYQMSYPSIGPPAVWLIDKGSIGDVENAAWDGLYFAEYVASPPYY